MKSLIKNSIVVDKIVAPITDPKYKMILSANRHSINKFLTQHSEIYGFTAKRAAFIVLDSHPDEIKDVFTNDNLLTKFYIDSKQIVLQE